MYSREDRTKGPPSWGRCRALPGGITLKEFPGRKFQFSSVGTSAADMTARILGEQNKLTRADAAMEVDRRGELRQYLAENLSGESVRLVIPKGASENAENIRAVVMAGGTNQVFPSCLATKPLAHARARDTASPLSLLGWTTQAFRHASSTRCSHFGKCHFFASLF